MIQQNFKSHIRLHEDYVTEKLKWRHRYQVLPLAKSWLRSWFQ